MKPECLAKIAKAGQFSVPDGRWMTAFWPQESLVGVDKLI
jgi:hypothetical protein